MAADADVVGAEREDEVDHDQEAELAGQLRPCRGRGRSRRPRRSGRRPRRRRRAWGRSDRSAEARRKHRRAARRSRGRGSVACRAPGSSSLPRKKSSAMLKTRCGKKLGVQEAAGDQPVPLAVRDRDAAQGEVVDDREAGVVQPAPAPGDLEQVGDDVDPDQDEGRRGAARSPRRCCRPPAPPWSAAACTPGSASRPGSGSCSRGRSAARRRSRRPRSRGRGGGNRSRPSGRGSLQSAPMEPASPARLYATAGRRPPRRARDRRLLLHASSAAPARSKPRWACSGSTPGSTSSTSPPARSACCSPARRPPLRARAGPPPTPPWRSGASRSAAARPSSASFLSTAAHTLHLALGLLGLAAAAGTAKAKSSRSQPLEPRAKAAGKGA